MLRWWPTWSALPFPPFSLPSLWVWFMLHHLNDREVEGATEHLESAKSAWKEQTSGTKCYHVEVEWEQSLAATK